MDRQPRPNFFHFLIVFMYILQSYFTIAIPISSLKHNASNLNVTLTSNANETHLFKRQEQQQQEEEVTVYTLKTLFLIDQTPKSQEEAERQKLAGILESINQKLRTEGTFGKYYFQLEAAKIVFQETLYLNEPSLFPVITKWKNEYPQKYGSEPVHAAMLLTRINNFAYAPTAQTDPTHVQYARQMIMQRHLMEMKYFDPTSFVKTEDPGVMARVYDPSRPVPEQAPPEIPGMPMRPIGVTLPNTICHQKATGVMTGWGVDSHRHAFESIFIHEFFHGFGIHHDPEFLPKCQGFVMEDGVSGDPPMKFSPCTKAAMEIIMKRPGFECLQQIATKGKPQMNGSKTAADNDDTEESENGADGSNGSNPTQDIPSSNPVPPVVPSSSTPSQLPGEPGLSPTFPSYPGLTGGFDGQPGGQSVVPGLGGSAGSLSPLYPMAGNAGVSPMTPQVFPGFQPTAGFGGAGSSMFGSSGGLFPPSNPYQQAGGLSSPFGSPFGASPSGAGLPGSGFGSPLGGSPFGAGALGGGFGGFGGLGGMGGMGGMGGLPAFG